MAAKSIHNQIVCEYNIQLFKREMGMAARIRHPNLLQFIGATLEGEMVIHDRVNAHHPEKRAAKSTKT